MDYLKRKLDLGEKVKESSVLLLGPRQTGKTSYVLNEVYADATWNLLDPRTKKRLQHDPGLLYDEIMALELEEGAVIFIDEIQKVPELLDVVHMLIEEKKYRFVMTGSSARKLKKEGVNLLGGRAAKSVMLPFTYEELRDDGEKSLEDILYRGMLPGAWNSANPDDFLESYIDTYLVDEVSIEGLVRNLPVFSGFLSLAASGSGDVLNYANIASDVEMSRTTVTEWYRILEDTLLGFQVNPWRKGRKRKSVTASKFYLFDVGLTRRLMGVDSLSGRGADFGKLFETYIAQELRVWLSYRGKKQELAYWRTYDDTEVDFILGDDTAIEVKSSERIGDKHLKGLRRIAEEKEWKHRIVVCQEDVPRLTRDGILILPWKEFLSRLWAGRFA